MTSLIKYEAARIALAECKATDEVKGWIDRAAAMQAYQKMAGDKSLEIDAAEIRIRAERKLGELIAAQKSEFGLNKGGRPSEKTGSLEEPVLNKTPTLSDAGINKKLSSRAQKLAAVPEDEFESEVNDWRERVEQEGARVSARLEKAGEKALKSQEQQHKIGGEVTYSLEVPYGKILVDESEYYELINSLEETVRDNAAMAKVFESDDQLKAATKEIKRLNDLCYGLEQNMIGYQSSENEAKKAAQMWKNKFDKLERQVKAAGLVDF